MEIELKADILEGEIPNPAYKQMKNVTKYIYLYVLHINKGKM